MRHLFQYVTDSANVKKEEAVNYSACLFGWLASADWTPLAAVAAASSTGDDNGDGDSNGERRTTTAAAASKCISIKTVQRC